MFHRIPLTWDGCRAGEGAWVSGLVGVEDVAVPPPPPARLACKRSWARMSGFTILRFPLWIWLACSRLGEDQQGKKRQIRDNT